jgi:hypothetical protein
MTSLMHSLIISAKQIGVSLLLLVPIDPINDLSHFVCIKVGWPSRNDDLIGVRGNYREVVL